jgi:hypothetical protein
MGGFGKIMEGGGKFLDRKRREGERQSNLDDYRLGLKTDANRAGSVDYTPAYTADLVPAYERSQSPAARAYLESMLTGQNPDAVAPWAAGGEQARQTASFNDSYGSYDDLLARGEAYRKTQPWKTKTPGPVDQDAIAMTAPTTSRYSKPGRRS